MRTLCNVLIINAIIFFSSSCSKESLAIKKNRADFTQTQEQILNSSNTFGLYLLHDLIDSTQSSENIFISPLSISLALTMTYNGAAGQTAIDMQKTLGYEGMSKEDINKTCKELMNIILNLDPKVVMEIANSIWYRNSFVVKQDFLNLNKNYFNAEVHPADFNSSETVNLINDWVNNQTHEKINKIIDKIDPATVMYLINAIYFKGTWKYKFETKNTKKEPFYLADSSTFDTDFMVQQDTFQYLSNDILTAVELPYGEEGFSMLILEPQTGKTYHDVIKNLNSANWDLWNNALAATEVQIHFPKFRFSYEKKLNESLSRLGMGIALSDQADFSGISDAARLCISSVLHKSFVEVNEEGTEAAAVTSVGISLASIAPSYKILYINKPFVFAIKENTTNSILFIGLVQKPVNE